MMVRFFFHVGTYHDFRSVCVCVCVFFLNGHPRKDLLIYPKVSLSESYGLWQRARCRDFSAWGTTPT